MVWEEATREGINVAALASLLLRYFLLSMHLHVRSMMYGKFLT